MELWSLKNRAGHPLEDFKKDQERLSQGLEQQKQYDLSEQWTRFLREKAKVSINQDLL